MNLRTARRLKGITQKELEAMSGIDQTTISAIECGKNKNPSWTIVFRIAKALGVMPEEIFPLDHGDISTPFSDSRSLEGR